MRTTHLTVALSLLLGLGAVGTGPSLIDGPASAKQQSSDRTSKLTSEAMSSKKSTQQGAKSTRLTASSRYHQWWLMPVNKESHKQRQRKAHKLAAKKRAKRLGHA